MSKIGYVLPKIRKETDHLSHIFLVTRSSHILHSWNLIRVCPVLLRPNNVPDKSDLSKGKITLIHIQRKPRESHFVHGDGLLRVIWPSQQCQPINQSIFSRQCNYKQTSTKSVVRCPTKLATLRQKDRQITYTNMPTTPILLSQPQTFC